ncbi:MAG: ImmA/IrrE family metallo-endopeptidase [Candidatus Woesearchaeota archaeon]
MKEFIDSLVSQYGYPFDYDRMCNDKNIRYFESDFIVVPFTQICEGYEIFNHDFSDDRIKEYFKLHEFGHALLGHTKADEDQANAFAGAFFDNIEGIIKEAREEILSKEEVIIMIKRPDVYERVINDIREGEPTHPRSQMHYQTPASPGSYSGSGIPSL